MESQDTIGRITYLKWRDAYNKEKPFQILSDIPKDAKDQRTTNLEWEDHETRIRDVRGNEDHYSLDEHGFAFRTIKPLGIEVPDRRFIEEEYLPQLESFLQKELKNVQRVFFFDWRVNNLPLNLRMHVTNIK